MTNLNHPACSRGSQAPHLQKGVNILDSFIKREERSAAERRKSLATAEGRGLVMGAHEPVRGERIFRRAAALTPEGRLSHAFSRG